MTNISILPAWRRAILPILLVFFSVALPAQQRLLVLDKYTGEPVSGAAFQYGAQTGFSDADGAFSIQFTDKTNLVLSHLAYENLILADESLTNALESGKIYWESKSISLQPATVLVLHAVNASDGVLNVGYQEHLQHDAGSFLSQNPAIGSIRKSGTYGFDPVLRGFKNDQLNIVINGAQCATAACPNRMDPPSSQVALNMIKKVEILKGPYNLRYGGGFGGTLNFQMPEPAFAEKRAFFGRISGGYESNGGILRSEALLGTRGKNCELGLFGSWSEGNDYTDGNGTAVPSDFLRGSFGAKFGLKLSQKQHISLSATRNLARDSDFPALPMDLRKDDTWLFYAQHQVSVNGVKLSAWNTSIYASLVNHLMNNDLKIIIPRTMNAESDASTTAFGGRSEGEFQFGKGQLFAGVDLRVEQASGTREREFIAGPNAGKTFYDNIWQDGQVSRSGIFGEYRFPLKSLKMVLSGRVEYNAAAVKDADAVFSSVYPETDAAHLNPSLSIGAVKNFENGFSTGLWLGRAQRSGNITERYINYFPIGLDAYEMLGNPQLKPEVNNQADLNLGFKLEKTALELTLFAAYLQNYISSEKRADLSPRIPTAPGVRQYVNIDNALATGFEISWSQHWAWGLYHQLGIAYTNGENLVLEEPLPEIAPLDLRFKLGGNYFKNVFRPEIALRHVLKQDRVSSAFGEPETPAFTLLDFNLNVRITKWARVAAGVQNLLDEAYYEHLNRSISGTPPTRIYAPGRSYFVSFTVDMM